jgi:hypothetical protein
MRSFFKFLSSISLSLLFLVASNTYAMHTHHCGGQAIESSFMTKAEGCGMEMHLEIEKKSIGFNALPCCSDIVSQMTSGMQSFNLAASVDIDFVPKFYPNSLFSLSLPTISNEKDFVVSFCDPPIQNSFKAPSPSLIQVFII